MARAATTSDVFNAIAEPRRREIIALLSRGERAVAGVDRFSALASPFTALAQAAFEAGRRARRGGARPARKDDAGDEDVTAL